MDKSKFTILVLFSVVATCYAIVITHKILLETTDLENINWKTVKNYPCDKGGIFETAKFLTRVKRNSEEDNNDVIEIDDNDLIDVVLKPKENKLIKNALKEIPLNTKKLTCDQFLKWQKKQVKEFNKLNKKWNKKKLKQLYDPDFSVKLDDVIHKSTVVCGLKKQKLCKFYQEFMDKKWAKLTKNKSLTDCSGSEKMEKRLKSASTDEKSEEGGGEPAKFLGMTVPTMCATLFLLACIILLFGLSKYCNAEKEKRFEKRMSEKERNDDNETNIYQIPVQNTPIPEDDEERQYYHNAKVITVA